MTDEQRIQEFEQGRAPGGSFHHRDHLQMAFLYLSRYPFLEALERFCGALKRFATAQGKPGLYHETITWAYLFLIRERLALAGQALTWTQFVAQNPDLMAWKDGVLQRYYREPTLSSPLARSVFVLPDKGLNAP